MPTHTQIHVSTRIHARTHTPTHTLTYIHTHTHTHTHTLLTHSPDTSSLSSRTATRDSSSSSYGKDTELITSNGTAVCGVSFLKYLIKANSRKKTY